MSNQAMKIPTMKELIANTKNLNYTVNFPDQKYTFVFLKLNSSHPSVPVLTQYALLVIARVVVHLSVNINTTDL